MRDDSNFLDRATLAAQLEWRNLSLADWEALPVNARVSDRLVQILILASEVRVDLDSPEAVQLAWVTTEIERVFAETDALLQRLAS